MHAMQCTYKGNSRFAKSPSWNFEIQLRYHVCRGSCLRVTRSAVVSSHYHLSPPCQPPSHIDTAPQGVGHWMLLCAVVSSLHHPSPPCQPPARIDTAPQGGGSVPNSTVASRAGLRRQHYSHAISLRILTCRCSSLANLFLRLRSLVGVTARKDIYSIWCVGRSKRSFTH